MNCCKLFEAFNPRIIKVGKTKHFECLVYPTLIILILISLILNMDKPNIMNDIFFR